MESNDKSCEPMDIDLSNQSIQFMDNSNNETIGGTTLSPLRSSVSPLSNEEFCYKSNSERESTVKKFHINIRRQPRNFTNKYLKIIALVVTILISLIAFHVRNIKCCDQLNLDLLRQTLSSRLYGQTEAINLIIKTLETKANSKILFFSGGTGVGKTLTSSLLLETMGVGSNVYHYTMPTFKNTFSTDLMFGLIMCRMSLIIVDDLTINDMDVKEQIKTVIEKGKGLNKKIIVVLIYNCNEDHENFEKRCNTSLKSKLVENFSDVEALKSYIQFKPLLDIHLKECVQHELGDRKINNSEFSYVLKNFNVSVDGCKGVHSKLKYLIP